MPGPWKVWNGVTGEVHGYYDSMKKAREKADREDMKYGKSVNAFQKQASTTKKKSKLKIA